MDGILLIPKFLSSLLIPIQCGALRGFLSEMGCYCCRCIPTHRDSGSPLSNWQTPAALLFCTLFMGVMPLLLVYYFCAGCVGLLYLFGIITAGMGLPTLATAGVWCAAHTCVCCASPEEMSQLKNSIV
jgi:hypothetical protein